MATQPFIFDSSKGESPQSIARLRAIAEALAQANGRAPKDVGEGLTALGNAIAYRMMMAKAGKAEAAGLASANDAFSGLGLESILGGGDTGGGSPAVSPPAIFGPDGANMPPATGGMNEPPPASSASVSGGHQDFVDMLMPAAVAASQRIGVDPRIIVAQAAQETGWGAHAPGNNFFGVKSHGMPGGQTLGTHEYVGGQRVAANDSFRTYGSPEDSVSGYADFMLSNPRYKPFMQAEGLDAQLAALGQSGYATDPGYANSVGRIARALAMPGAGNQPIQVASNGPMAFTQPAPTGANSPATAAVAPIPQQAGPAAAAPVQVAQAGGTDINKIMQVLSNPFATDGQKAVAKALLDRQMQQSDPMSQLQMEEERLKIEQMRNPSPKPTDDITEYNFYVNQEKAAGRQPLSFNDWSLQSKKAGASTTNVSVAGENAYDKTLNEGLAKTMMGVSDSAGKATAQLSTIQQMRQLANSPGFYSGVGGDLALKGKQLLSVISGNKELAQSGEDFRALSNKLVYDRLGSLGNQISNADRTFIENMVPNINMTPAGVGGLLDIYERLSNRDIQVAQIANDYAASHNGRLDTGWQPYLADWANKNPLFPEAPPKPEAPAGGFGDAGAPPKAWLDGGGSAETWKYLDPAKRKLFQ